ncbi:MAG: DUF4234 domain-containing protein [Actinomyces urogenitalis]|uniref:DUF4234 domain-containing protein n=5 Tax=Bacillati TaxID=1783272 RepID=C0W2Y0_9ACTO|nr:DUF4234 domain-containing protein [Actinomyces urogenitalis]EEH66920.1 hypothetical protein HMPREF0058_0224 [Actinomyces urogenitalis DSM 15434]MDK8834861.1 DUF4234 domain-containing protein [Actinomyces urogenitalis]MDU0971609.1 DUF4234 domain-containing protein [Actinomyces urogenitalis]MDU6150777.1 DUF4234 domain-containing protein [Actinomyces urogenitalis]PKY99663.1 DUF4234 domain-containing protein [Actinomyces urogenitalis]
MSINPLTLPEQWAQAFRQVTGREPTQADYDAAVRTVAPAPPSAPSSEAAAGTAPAPVSWTTPVPAPPATQPSASQAYSQPVPPPPSPLSAAPAPQASAPLPPLTSAPSAAVAAVPPVPTAPPQPGGSSAQAAPAPGQGAGTRTAGVTGAAAVSAVRSFFEPRISLDQVRTGFQTMLASPQTHLPQALAAAVGLVGGMSTVLMTFLNLRILRYTLGDFDYWGFATGMMLMIINLVCLVGALAGGAVAVYMAATAVAVPSRQTSVKAALSTLALPVAFIVVPLLMWQVVFRVLNWIIRAIGAGGVWYTTGPFEQLSSLVWPYYTTGKISMVFMFFALAGALVSWLVATGQISLPAAPAAGASQPTPPHPDPLSSAAAGLTSAEAAGTMAGAAVAPTGELVTTAPPAPSQAGAYGQSAPAMPTAANSFTTSRSLIGYLIASFFTFGLYSLYRWSEISSTINAIASRYDGRKTMHYLLLALIVAPLTLGIGYFVWSHNICGRIGAEAARRGRPGMLSSADFWLWMVLGSLIIVGPFVYCYRVFQAMNFISESYNTQGI